MRNGIGPVATVSWRFSRTNGNKPNSGSDRHKGKVPVIAPARKVRPGVLLVLDPADAAMIAREHESAHAVPADASPLERS